MEIKKIPIVSGFFYRNGKQELHLLKIPKPFAPKSNITFNHYSRSVYKHRLLF